MLYAFLATFISTVSLVAHKFTLSNLKVNSRVFNLVVFIFLAGTALIWAYFNNTFPDKSFFEGFSLLLFVAVVFIAFAWNALFSYALQKEQMPEAEIIIALSPILTIMLALMFLPEERNLAILIPAFIAGAALVWANIGKHHFYFSRSEQILLIAVLGIATETILIKHLLSFIAAEALYALRCFFTLPFFALLIGLGPRIKQKLNLTQISTTGAIGILAAFQMIFFYRAYFLIGVAETTLISILGPILVLSFCPYFLKQKVSRKQWIALIIILICIIISELNFKL